MIYEGNTSTYCTFMIDQESSKTYTALQWGIGVVISNFGKTYEDPLLLAWQVPVKLKIS